MGIWVCVLSMKVTVCCARQSLKFEFDLRKWLETTNLKKIASAITPNHDVLYFPKWNKWQSVLYIDRKVRSVRLQTDNFSLFLRQQTDKGVKVLLFARWENSKGSRKIAWTSVFRLKSQCPCQHRSTCLHVSMSPCLHVSILQCLHVSGIPETENGNFLFFRK